MKTSLQSHSRPELRVIRETVAEDAVVTAVKGRIAKWIRTEPGRAVRTDVKAGVADPVVSGLAVLGPAALEPKEMKSTAMMAAQIHAAAQNMPVTAGILFLFSPVLLGLVLGAGAHAYRTLEGGSG